MKAEDYSWFKGSTLSYGYCMTFVRGLARSEALRRIDAEPEEHVTGVVDFIDFAGRSHS